MYEPIEVLKVKELRELTCDLVQKHAKFFRNRTYVSMEKSPDPSLNLTVCTMTCRGCAFGCTMRFQIPGEPLYASVVECAKVFSSLCKKLDEVPVVYDAARTGLPPHTLDANDGDN